MDTYLTTIIISTLSAALMALTVGPLVWAEVLDGRDEAASAAPLSASSALPSSAR